MNSFQSGRFGELRYAERDVITLPEGLVGLPSLKRWILLDMDRAVPLKWLQSLDDGAFGLPVTTSEFYAADYAPRLADPAVARLGGDPREVTVLIVTTVHPGGAQLTGNLAAPLLVQPATRLGLQQVLDDPRWPLRQEIDYVRFSLAIQATAGQRDEGTAEPVVEAPEGERQEIAL
jgi:flagellar assembly factor FliW